MKASHNKLRTSPVDLHYLASFLDGFDRDFLDRVADVLDYEEIAKERHVTVRMVKQKARTLTAVAYEIMWECIYGNIDIWTLKIYDLKQHKEEIENKLFLEEVRQRVKHSKDEIWNLY